MSFGTRIASAATSFLLMIALANLSACAVGGTTRNSSSADEDAIRRMATEYTQAIARGDRETFLSFYADDIVVMPP